MSGITNFPTALDDDSVLGDVTDNVTPITAAHHNNLKEALKAIEAKIGIRSTSAPTTLDYRLGHPTSGHLHNGASGQGPLIPATAIGGLTQREVVSWQYQGSLPSGASLGAPLRLGRTYQIESVMAQFRRAPSGATAALDINIGPTSLWQASNGLRPIFPAGTNAAPYASVNFQTYPSGALLVVDADKVGTNEPGSDLSITFVFRE